MGLNFSLTLRERGLRLLRDELGGLAEDGAALGVAENHVGDLGVGELGWADLAGEGTRGDVVAVLRGDGDGGALDKIADAQKVERGRGDDDLCEWERGNWMRL